MTASDVIRLGPAIALSGAFGAAIGIGVSPTESHAGDPSCRLAWSPALPGFDAFDNFDPIEHSGRIFDLVAWDENGQGPGDAALFACGWFRIAGGAPAYSVVKWDGQSWVSQGFDVRDRLNCLDVFNCASPLDMQVFDDGMGEALYVCGGLRLSRGFGAEAASVWKYDGAWTIPGPNGRTVTKLLVHDDGSGSALYAIYDDFEQVGIDRLVAGAWTPYPDPPAGIAIFQGAASFDDGSGPAIWIGGDFVFQDFGVFPPAVIDMDVAGVLADGTFVLPNGGVMGAGVFDLAVWDADGLGPAPPVLVVGGEITGANLIDTDMDGGVDTPTLSVSNVAAWDGMTWSDLGPGIPSETPVMKLLVVPNDAGDSLYATTLSSGFNQPRATAGVYRLEDGQWRRLGGPMSGGLGGLSVNGQSDEDSTRYAIVRDRIAVHALTPFDLGSGEVLIAGGDFEFADGEKVNAIAVLDGVRLDGDANGDLVVNFADITAVLTKWLDDFLREPVLGDEPFHQGPGTGEGDANGDSAVNFQDITSVLGNWLESCP